MIKKPSLNQFTNIKINNMKTLHTYKKRALIIIILSIFFWGACKKTDQIEGSLVPAAIENHSESRMSGVWVDSWAASFLSTTVNGAIQSTPSFNNQTYRLNIFTKLGGTQVRVKLTNKFATNSLIVGAAHIALRLSNNSIVSSTDRQLTFNGLAGVTLAPNSEIWSDPVTLTVAQHVTVAISVYIPGYFHPTTFHPTGLHTSYISSSGNYTASTTLPLGTWKNSTTQVLMVSDVQVSAPPSSKVAICFGNSIPDGAGAMNNNSCLIITNIIFDISSYVVFLNPLS